MNLLRKTKLEYGDLFESHCLEIYKIYVEMADRISQRRQTANSFFLSINTAIIGAVGYVGFGDVSKVKPMFYALIAFAGLVLCVLWYYLVLSYKSMNSHKFGVIHQIEENMLPLAPYKEEWRLAEEGKNWRTQIPFTHIEQWVPLVFFALHLFVLIFGLDR